MKIVVEYTLPEDDLDFTMARDGWKRWSQLRDIENRIKKWRTDGCDLTAEQILEQIWLDYIPHDLHDHE